MCIHAENKVPILFTESFVPCFSRNVTGTRLSMSAVAKYVYAIHVYSLLKMFLSVFKTVIRNVKSLSLHQTAPTV